MFGIGFPEMILILALALIVVGPDKLPDLARSVAKTIMDLKKTAEGLKDNLNLEDNPLSEIKPQLEEAAKNFKDTVLDAETHTWKDSSLPQSPYVDPLEESLKDPGEPNQEEQETPQTGPIESEEKNIQESPLKNQPLQSTDTGKNAE